MTRNNFPIFRTKELKMHSLWVTLAVNMCYLDCVPSKNCFYYFFVKSCKQLSFTHRSVIIYFLYNAFYSTFSEVFLTKNTVWNKLSSKYFIKLLNFTGNIVSWVFLEKASAQRNWNVVKFSNRNSFSTWWCKLRFSSLDYFMRQDS